jgi:hypothetical protein
MDHDHGQRTIAVQATVYRLCLALGEGRPDVFGRALREFVDCRGCTGDVMVAAVAMLTGLLDDNDSAYKGNWRRQMSDALAGLLTDIELAEILEAATP